MSSSRLEKVRSSIFRSKGDSPSPRRTSRPFSRILSSPRPKSEIEQDEPQALEEEIDDQPEAVDPPRESSSTTQLPLNPRTSPASLHAGAFGSRPSTRDYDVPLPSRELRYDTPSSDTDVATNGYPHHEVYSDTTEMDERYMKRKLMDMESSFLADHPPVPSGPISSHNIRHGETGQSQHRTTDERSAEDSSFLDSMSSAPRNAFETPAEYFHTPATRHTYRISEEKSEDVDEDDTEHLVKHSLSSPSAAAAQRSKLRAAAGFSPLRNGTTLGSAQPRGSSKFEPSASRGEIESPSSAPHEQMRTSNSVSDVEAQPEDPSDETLPNHHDSSRASPSHDLKRSSSEQLKPTAGRRPSYLKSRQASQRSSASSHISNEGDFLGTGSGVGTPRSHSTVRPDHELSRLPSLGSVASTMSINTDRSASYRRRRHANGLQAGAQESNLTPVAEHRSKTQSPPETPRAGMTGLSDPRDTVIARNVRDVQVPATVARNYREAQSFGSTAKSFGTPNFSRTKGELTLKEQNSRIDKLSKENFDLKLKIHYLYQALQDRSDEGVKDLIAKNAQLSTDVIKVRKENQALRKRIKQLERESKARDDGLSAVRTVSESEDLASSRSWQQAQLEDEIAYLRERMQGIEEDNERLRQGDVAREFEKRRMANQVRSIASGDQGTMLRDELEQEKSKRERSERETHQLRLEISRLRSDRSPMRGTHLRPNDYQQEAQGRPVSKSSAISREAPSLSGTTVVDQLKQENADLRRDLGAQTSMLTSRNRERERLQQEIEDLKLLQRRGEGLQSAAMSLSGDSLLDRSVSRNNLRPPSRASTHRTEALSETEKDQYEVKQARLRDENAGLRMRIQDLQGELDMLTGSAEHLENLRRERDDALILIEEERDFAADAIDRLEEQMETKDKDINQLLAELRAKEDESQALDQEIRDISASLSRVADESENGYNTIQSLQSQLAEATGECEAAQQNLQDAMAAKERLEVQAESSQSEIAFLRDEQEGDKIRISDLQTALHRAKARAQDEKERAREFEDMEAETKAARDEARRLKKTLSSREEEATTHREALDEVADGLRHATGSTEQSLPLLVKFASKLRRELESSRSDLEHSKGGLGEKHQRLQDHIMLLESSEAERHRLSTTLEKEIQARKQDQVEHERSRQSPTDHMAELEAARARDQQRLSELEHNYNDALRERNQLLYNLWTRLSALCGPEWVENFPAATNQVVPSFESISETPSSVDAPLSMALDTISQTLSTFRTRIRSTEKDVYRDLDVLAHDLDTRSKRIDDLERTLAQQGLNAGDPNAAVPAELTRLKEENRLLRRELKILKQGAFALPGLPSPQLELDNAAQEAALVEHERHRIKNGLSRKVSNSSSHRSRRHRGPATEDEPSALQRHHSSAALEPTESDYAATVTAPSVNGDHPQSMASSEQRWLLRLKEMERRLRAEREGRVLDRAGAHQRLEQQEKEAKELKRRLDMEKQRTAFKESRQQGVNGQEVAPESRGG